MKKSNDTEAYIEKFPKQTQILLEKVRSTIKKAAPRAEEVMSYGIPTFRQNGILVHFGAFKNHIGFFPTSSGVKAFQKELLPYHTSKGAIQFPIEKSLPIGLITKIVKFKLKENLNKEL